MTQAFLDSPDFGFYETLTPFGLYLFYLYNFIVSICIPPHKLLEANVVLLNILIALFNQAYSVVTGSIGKGIVSDGR